MSKTSRLRESLGKQHGRRAQALLKSASYHLYHIYWVLGSQLNWKNSLLLTWRILRLVANTMAADEKYRIVNRDNFTIPIQMQLSQKQKTFSQFFAVFLKFRLNFEYFETKYAPLRFCVSQITASENVVRKMSKNPRFRRPFDNQHGKRSQALFKSVSHHLYHIHWSLLSNLSWKKFVFLTCQILGYLVNTLATDEKYPVLNRDNLTMPIQMPLSLKKKFFFWISWCIFEI